MEGDDRLRQLEGRLVELGARMPAHSVRPAMLMELEDLEEEIAQLRGRPGKGDGADAQGSA